MSAGSVLNFGADPLGNSDSYSAFQAAVDSPHAVEVPPGYYYLSQPVVFTKPKIVRMTRPLLEPFDIDPLRRPHRGPGPNIPESHSRLWTDKNINFFEIRSPQVFVDGGCFDAQKVTNWTKAALYYSGDAKDHNDRINGWGGGADNFMVIGNYLDMVLNGADGGYGVHFDFENYPVRNAYWTHMHHRGVMRGLRAGWYSSPFSPGNAQWANTSSVNLEIDYSKQSIVNNAFTGLTIRSIHQSRPVFLADQDAEDSPSIVSMPDRTVLEDTAFWDFGEYQDPWTKCFKNRYTVELHGESIVKERFPTIRSRAKYIAATRPDTTLDGAEGFIPRQSEGQSLFIPDLHDALFAAFQSATITTSAYKGRPDLVGLLKKSDGEESGDITIQNKGYLFKWNKTFERYFWNDLASQNEDYVEIHISNIQMSIRNLWITFSDGSSPQKIQVILLDSNGEAFFNETRDVPPVNTISNVRTEYFKPHWTEFSQMIIRFIGSAEAGGMIPHYIAGSDSRHRYQHPLVHV